MQSLNLINGNILTQDEQNPKASSVYIEDGKIKQLNFTQNNAKTINLDGATVIPGFIDAHFHLKNYGKRLEELNLKGLSSLNEIKKILIDKINTTKKGDWIFGFGWDQNLWNNKTFPPSTFLNKIAPNNPIYFTRIDGHACWVNEATIIKISLTIKQLNDIDGGKVINNCVVIDNAMGPFKKHLPKENKQQVKRWIKLAADNASKMGITGVHDAWQDRITVESIIELINENKFPIRCYGMLASNDQGLLNEYFNQGHYQNEYLTIRSVKAFIDGALGSRGAALHEPYSDDHNNCGLILISKEEFSKLATQCYKHNFQLNTHAIGDKGNDFVLNHYAKTLGSNNNRRWRIEHAQMVADQDIYQFKKYNILPSMQPSHCTSDMKWLPGRIGNHRLKLISRWQSFINAGLKIPGGSDCPIETGNPLFEFYAAITRQNHQGWPKKGFQPQEKVDRKHALKMFTSWAAYGGFEDNKRGQIKIGFDADLTILDNNLLSVESHNILKTKILYTIVNGKIIIEKERSK